MYVYTALQFSDKLCCVEYSSDAFTIVVVVLQQLTKILR